MPYLLLTLLLTLKAFVPAQPDPYPRDPRVDVLHYTFGLTVSDASDDILGETTLTVRFLADGVDAVTLDLIGKARSATGMTVTHVAEGDADVPFRHANDRLRLALEPAARAGEQRTFTVAYRGVPADGLVISTNKFGDRTFFGDNWPDRARHWLPTVDHPSDKATCTFVVTAPNRYQVVGSGALVEETDLPGDLRLTRWRTDVPMATKVMVVGIARFAVEVVDEVQGVPVESWVYPQERDAGFYDYALAVRILRFFADRVGPFPYEKLANVQSKTRFGGMENASNIFYHEGSITGDRASEGLLAHEIAHQWFGDSVTEADWYHVWLSEGFATYFTQLYLEHTYGRERLEAGMRQARASVLTYAAQRPRSPVVDTTITDLMGLLSPNAYQKGAWVLHMLRHTVGDDAFWDGIQAYYRQYRDGNAWTRDFRDVMEMASGLDLDAFFRQWLYTPGQPRFEGTWRYDADAHRLTVILSQDQDGPVFQVPLELGITTAPGTLPRIERLDVDERVETYSIDLETPPAAVTLDPNVWLLMDASFGPAGKKQ